MDIPNQIRNALAGVGLTPSDWKTVRAAFASTEAILGDDMRQAELDLRARAATLEVLAGKIQEIQSGLPPDLPPDLPLDLGQLERWGILRGMRLHGHEGARSVARNLGIGCTTLYRKLNEYGVPTKAISAAKQSMTVEQILSEIRDIVSSIPAVVKQAVQEAQA